MRLSYFASDFFLLKKENLIHETMGSQRLQSEVS